MVKLNDLEANGVFKTVLYPENAFPEGSEWRKAWAGTEITFRELDEQEARAIYETGGAKEFGKMLSKLIVEHNVEKESGELASNEQVAKLLRNSASVYTYVLQEWQAALPLATKNAGNSDKSETV